MVAFSNYEVRRFFLRPAFKNTITTLLWNATCQLCFGDATLIQHFFHTGWDLQFTRDCSKVPNRPVVFFKDSQRLFPSTLFVQMFSHTPSNSEFRQLYGASIAKTGVKLHTHSLYNLHRKPLASRKGKSRAVAFFIYAILIPEEIA